MRNFAGLTSLLEKKIWQSDYLYAKHSTVLLGVEVFGLQYVFSKRLVRTAKWHTYTRVVSMISTCRPETDGRQYSKLCKSKPRASGPRQRQSVDFLACVR